MTQEFPSWINLNSTVTALIILAFLGHILRERKPPTSTIAWLLMLILQPYVGIILYILIGSRKYKSEKPIIHSSPMFVKGSLNHFEKILLTSGAPPSRSVERIQFIKSSEEAYFSLIKLIQEAKVSIFIETYIFKNDYVGNLILEELLKKAKEGLDVRVLLDSLGAHLPSHPSFKDFINAGGKFEKFLPLFRKPNLRNHRKQIIIDDHTAMVGGMNIGNEYMGPEENDKEWVDLALIVNGEIVKDLVRVFHCDWVFATQGEQIKKHEDGNYHNDEHRGQVVISGPDVLSDPIYELFLSSFYQAKERIWMTTPYFIPDESLAKALELAAKRKIDVRLCVPLKSNHILADLGRRTYLQQLHDSGVKIFYYPNMLHAKATLVDSEYCFVGSANMDSRSLLLNYEIGLCMYDTKSVEESTLWFRRVYSRSSITFERLTVSEEFIGAIARLFSPLI